MKRVLLRSWKRRNYRTVRRGLCSNSLKEGDVIHNYQVTRISSVPQLFLSAVELKHLVTNSKHLHLARDDDNNVFNVLLRTTPMDSTGVAHILEHIVLCGSKKYPVRDPFFKMLDRSMATFMNAMTGSDYTMYPFATQNATDFRNLLSVYLDAVFFPQLTESSFLQEGWRLEHADCNSRETPVILKGVVFNEMKGVMADQEYLFGSNMQQKLLPDHTYGVCSGGDPLSIPELTWEGLKKFHAIHYHPSNARFFTYGNMDLAEHLKQIDEQVMQKFTPISPNTDVPSQPRWSAARTTAIKCSPDQMAANPEKQTSVALSFLLSDVSNSYETFVLSFLCSLLSDGPASPFYKALIDSGIGSSYSPAAGFHNHQKECIFSIGLQGILEEDASKVEAIIHKTLDTVIEEGFSSERIDALLHQVELHQKHQKSQFGLHLSFNHMPLWQHDADPLELLDVDKHIARLRRELDDDPSLFQKYCRKYFSDNQHRLTLTMSPDNNYEKKMEEKEAQLLQSKLQRLRKDDLEDLYHQGQDLGNLQTKKEDLSCLPTLLVSDIPRTQLETKIGDEYTVGDNTRLVMQEQPTNGVTYVTLIKTVNFLPDELKPFLPLFCTVLTQMGTQNTDYRRFSELEELYTGGLQASVSVSPSPVERNSLESSVIFQSHCLDKNVQKMLDLWTELLQKPYFGDRERFRTLVRQSAQELANSVPFSGHLYAMSHASSELSPYALQTEEWEGLTQVRTMQSVAKDDDMDIFVEKMQRIAEYLLLAEKTLDESARCCIHSTADVRSEVQSKVTNFLADIFKERGTLLRREVTGQEIQRPMIISDFEPCPPRHVQQELPLPVNFASMCLPTSTTYTHPDSAPLRILARILTTKFLLREVREKGGAYGAGARRCADGVFQFFSYRDPRSTDTIKSFADSISWACEGGFSPNDLDEAKLAVFQQVDAPVSPSNRGMTYFKAGVSDQMRQAHREQLLDTTRENVTEAANKYLKAENKISVILGPKNKEIEADPRWKVANAT